MAHEQLKHCVEKIAPGKATRELDDIDPMRLLDFGVKPDQSLGVYRWDHPSSPPLDPDRQTLSPGWPLSLFPPTRNLSIHMVVLVGKCELKLWRAKSAHGDLRRVASRTLRSGHCTNTPCNSTTSSARR